MGELSIALLIEGVRLTKDIIIFVVLVPVAEFVLCVRLEKNTK